VTIALVTDQLRLIQQQDKAIAALAHRKLDGVENLLGEVTLTLGPRSDGE
jgi:hypothetical protein